MTIALDPLYFSSPMRAALSGAHHGRTPVWFMRQAGRSLPEYRESRAGVAMLDACLDPALAAEITLQPVRRHDVDAAVFFSDIVVPLKLAGIDIDIVPGRGPVLGSPVASVEDVDRLVSLEVADWGVIEEAAALVRSDLAFDKVLFGFAGAPFTLASYLIEAGGERRRECLQTRDFIAREPQAWNRLATWCAKLSGQFMAAQIRGGAEAVQLFDSWAGALDIETYRSVALPYSCLAFQGAPGATHVHFGVGTSHLLEAMGEISQAVSISNDTSLSQAAARLPGKVLQGNLDPELVVEAADMDQIWRAAQRVLREGLAAPAHIFNLGHGVLPQTDPGRLTELVARIHQWRAD